MSAKILIVDDEPRASLILEKMLLPEGYILRFANSGADGLLQAQTWQPDVILCDVVMPGIDGFEFCRCIRADANLGQVPILLVTGLHDRQTKLNGLQAGADDFLNKPIDALELHFRLRALTHLERFHKLNEEHSRLEEAHRELLQTLEAETIRRRILFEESPDGILVIDPQTAGFLEFNTRAHAQLGYSRAEFAQLHIFDVEAQESADETRAHISAVIQNGRSDFETRQRTKQGEIRNIHVTAQIVEILGKPVYFCIWRDITARKLAEESLSKSQSLLQEAQRIGRIGYMEWNSREQTLTCSDDLYTILDLSRDTAITQNTIASLMTPGEAERIQALDMEAIRQRTDMDYEYCIRPKTSGERWLHQVNKMTYDVHGAPIRMMAIIQDISERKRDEQYTQARLRLANLSYEAPDMETLMRAMLDEAEGLTDSAIGFFHYLEEDQNAINLQVWSTNTLDWQRRAKEGEQHTPVEQAGVWADSIRGRKPRIYNDYAALVNRQGLPDDHPPLTRLISLPIQRNNLVVAVIGLGNKPRDYDERDLELVKRLAEEAFDILLRKRAEIALRASEERYRLLSEELEERVRQRTAELQISRDKLSIANLALEKAARMKDEFMASMSHELRTPLTGILGLSESLQLQTYGPLSERQIKALRSIEDSGRHLLELINDILDLSKIEAGMLELSIETFSLAEICHAALQLIKGMAHKKRHEVSFSIQPSTIAMRGDARRIKQMLVNLLSNAIKFTPDNGALGLEVQASETDQVVRLTVWDKGIGIASENIERLFQPFVQLDSNLARQYSGTGLGLSLVQRMTKLHGGSVQVESALGAGSRFTILLPWLPTAARPAENLPGEAGALHTSLAAEDRKIVLIVDDNEMLIRTLADFLETQGLHVVAAHSGMELLEVAPELHPDIILMDIQMPAMDGIEATRRIRAHADPVVAKTPIVAVTALAMVGDREHCLAAGANEYLSKPVKLMELINTIHKLTPIKPAKAV